MNNIIQLIAEKVKGEIEGNLKGDILDKSTDVSYEKAAELSTLVNITREIIKNII